MLLNKNVRITSQKGESSYYLNYYLLLHALMPSVLYAFSALTLLVSLQEGPVKTEW